MCFCVCVDVFCVYKYLSLCVDVGAEGKSLTFFLFTLVTRKYSLKQRQDCPAVLQCLFVCLFCASVLSG